MNTRPPPNIVSGLKRGDRICLKECDSIRLFNEKPFIWDRPIEARYGIVLDPFYGLNSEVFVCVLLEQPLNIHPNDMELQYFEFHHDVENIHCLFLIPRRLLAEEIITIILYAPGRSAPRNDSLAIRRPSLTSEYRGSPNSSSNNLYGSPDAAYGRYSNTSSPVTPSLPTPPIRLPTTAVSGPYVTMQMEVEYLPSPAQIETVMGVLEVSAAVARHLLKKHCGTVEEAVNYYLTCDDKREFNIIDNNNNYNNNSTAATIERTSTPPVVPPLPAATAARRPSFTPPLRHTASETNARAPLAAAAAAAVHSTGSFSLPPRSSITDRPVRALSDPQGTAGGGPGTPLVSARSTDSSSVSSRYTAINSVNSRTNNSSNNNFNNSIANWRAGDRVLLKACTSTALAESQAHIWKTTPSDRRGVIVSITLGSHTDNHLLSNTMVMSFDKPINTVPTLSEESYISQLMAHKECCELRSSDARYVKVIPTADLQHVVLEKDPQFNQLEFKSYEVVLCCFPQCVDIVTPRGNTVLMCYANSHYVCKKHIFPSTAEEVQERTDFLQIQREIKSVGFAKGLNDPYCSARAAVAYFTKHHFPHLCGDGNNSMTQFYADLCEHNEYQCPMCRVFNLPLMAPFCAFQEINSEGWKELAAINSCNNNSNSGGSVKASAGPSLVPFGTNNTVNSSGSVKGGLLSGMRGVTLEGITPLNLDIATAANTNTNSNTTTTTANTTVTPSRRRSRMMTGRSPRHSARHSRGPRPLSLLYSSSMQQLKDAQELVDVLSLTMFGAKVLIQQSGTVDEAIAQFTCMTPVEQRAYTDSAYECDTEDDSEGEVYSQDEEEGEEQRAEEEVDVVGLEWSRNLQQAASEKRGNSNNTN